MPTSLRCTLATQDNHIQGWISKGATSRMRKMILPFCSGPETMSGHWVQFGLLSTRQRVINRNETPRCHRELWD